MDELPWSVPRAVRATVPARDAGPEAAPTPFISQPVLPPVGPAVMALARAPPSARPPVSREQLFDNPPSLAAVPALRRSVRERTPAATVNISSVAGQRYGAAAPTGAAAPAFIAEPDVDALIEHGAVFTVCTAVCDVLPALHPTLQQGYAHAAATGVRHGASAIPRTYKAAVTGPDRVKWQAADDVELANHERNGTFVECYVAPSVWLLNSMWIYDLKHDGRHKARLVALGNQLKARPGDPESSSPTAGQLEFRTIVAISTEMAWLMYSYDVTAAYLYGKVPAAVRIFMRLPPGYLAKLPAKAGFVIALRLAKGLYGLTFAGRLWHDDFAAYLLHPDRGYSRDISAPCVFYILQPIGHRQFIVLFVDDFTLTLEEEADRLAIERAVLAKYNITGVGIEVARTTTHTTLTQTSYILSKVDEFAEHLRGSSPLTPAVESVVLTKAMCPAPENGFPYSYTTGTLE